MGNVNKCNCDKCNIHCDVAVVQKIINEKKYINIQSNELSDIMTNENLNIVEKIHISSRYRLKDENITLFKNLLDMSDLTQGTLKNIDVHESILGVTFNELDIDKIYTQVTNNDNKSVKYFEYDIKSILSDSQIEFIKKIITNENININVDIGTTNALCRVWVSHDPWCHNESNRIFHSIMTNIILLNANIFKTKFNSKYYYNNYKQVMCTNRKTFLTFYCNNILNSCSSTNCKIKLSYVELKDQIENYTDIKYVCNGSTPNYHTVKKSAGKRGNKYRYETYISSYTHYKSPSRPSKLEELKMSYPNNYTNSIDMTLKELDYIKIFDINDVPNLQV